MGVEVQNLWKELKTDFSNITETELRGALCRAQHFQKQDANLRPQEAEIKNWLNQKGINPSLMYQWLSKTKKTKYAERYTERRQEQKWRILLELKTELNNALPEKTPEQIRGIVRKISRWEYGEIKNLYPDECILRDILLRHNIRPATVHKWLLKTVIPDDVRKSLEAGSIRLSQAQKLITNRERQRKAALEIQLLENARSLVNEVLLS